MNILSIANISNFDDINSDSGFIFNYLLAKEFIKKSNRFSIVFPRELTSSYDEFIGCGIYHANLGTTKYEARFSFDWKTLQEIIISNNPDVIVLNQCEMASALRALLISNAMNYVKIVTYCHYPALHADESGDACLDYSLNDGNLCQSIVFNILLAINVSDVFITQSAFAKGMLLSAAKKYNVAVNNEVHIIPPPFDPYLYQDISDKNNTQSNRPRKIIYNHRLYKSYGTEELMKIINLTKDAEILVTDPMPKRSQNRARFNSTPAVYVEKLSDISNVSVVNGSESRAVYKKYLREGCIGLAAYRKACVWSMAAIDCICMGIPVVAPNFAAYKEFIPDMLRYNIIEEAPELIHRLLFEEEFFQTALFESRKILCHISPNAIYKRLATLL